MDKTTREELFRLHEVTTQAALRTLDRFLSVPEIAEAYPRFEDHRDALARSLDAYRELYAEYQP